MPRSGLKKGGLVNDAFMARGQAATSGFEAEELRGFARTVAEIEWLLVILVMLYQVVQGRSDESNAQIYFGLIVYSLAIIGFRYFNIYRSESRWKLAIETWVMIVFITWVIYHTGRLE